MINFIWIFIDDVLSSNNPDFENFLAKYILLN